MTARVSFNYQVTQDRIGGWSENFWNAISFSTDLNDRIAALRKQLSFIRGEQTTNNFIRVSDPTLKRQVQILTYPDTPAPPSGSPDDTDFVDTAILLKLVSARGAITHQWLRGIPDGMVTNGGRYAPTGTFRSNLNGVISVLTKSAQYGWQVRIADPTYQPKALKNVGNFDPATGTVTLPGNGYSAGDMVRLSRVGGGVGANGLWAVTNVNNGAGTFQLLNYKVPSPVWTWNGMGYVRKISMIFDNIASVAPLRATSHRTGRPFGQLSGRRRKHRY